MPANSLVRSLAFIGLISLILPMSAALAQNASLQNSVVELFTSQGCSSCPPADRLLQDLSKKPGIIAMSFPVTYWDYLGWRDTLARQEYSERQRAYAEARGDGEVYTPQAVINGVKSCVGSNLDAIQEALNSTRQDVRKLAVPLQVHKENGKLIIDAGAAPEGSNARSGKVWVLSVIPSAAVTIGQGENAGRTVTYTNVVRKMTRAGDWQGAPASYAMPLTNTAQEQGDTLIVFLQAEHFGPIVAAARVDG